MNKEFLYMQKLAGIITESEYAAKINEGLDDSTDGGVEKYYAVFNYLGDYNNGVPLYFTTNTKEEMVDKLNQAYKEFTGETYIPYSMRDMEEQTYGDTPLETYISDDWATVTRIESVFKQELKNVAGHLGTQPEQYV